METKDGNRQLHQIVTGGDHQQMKKRKPEQRFYALRFRKRRHIVTFLYVGVREPNKNRSMILLWQDNAMVSFYATVNLVCIAGYGA
ncbi:hypothetical protein [Enterobacter cloacae]